MTAFQSIILGILQGVAEFLPISSSGHLAVAQKLFGLEEVPLLFDVFLHLATLLAVCIFFRKKIFSLLCTFVRVIFPKKNPDEEEFVVQHQERRYIVAVISATVITGAIGIFTSKVVPEVSVRIVCAGFIVTAFLLIASSIVERKSKSIESDEEKAPSFLQSLIIGFAQGIGTLPGISRSGSTISASLFCGVNRNVAGEFSFIVSIPAILGAFLLELKDLGKVTGSVGTVPLIAGCAAAFVSGYLALAFLMKIIKKGRLQWFAAYLIPLGIFGICYF